MSVETSRRKYFGRIAEAAALKEQVIKGERGQRITISRARGAEIDLIDVPEGAVITPVGEERWDADFSPDKPFLVAPFKVVHHGIGLDRTTLVEDARGRRIGLSNATGLGDGIKCVIKQLPHEIQSGVSPDQIIISQVAPVAARG